jgi:hypothetical protein
MEKSGKFGNSLISTSQAPRHETKQQKSMKEVRDEENTHALGGMRNPNAAVASLKGWPQVGNTLRSVLDDVMDECPLIEEMIAKLRNKENPENCSLYMQSLAAAAEAAAAKIGKRLEITGAMQTGPSGWRWKLMQGITALAGDPDVDVADWMGGCTPLGIKRTIPSRGIFPASGPTDAQLEAASYLASRSSAEVSGNYSSYKENEVHAKTELARLLKEGHLELIGSWADVVARWPEAMATKLAVLVKEKPDGTIKIRFIVDMLRSGINSLIKAGERIVLPRGQDLISSVLDPWESLDPDHEAIEFLVADVKDAFLLMKIAEDERAYTIVTDGGLYYAYVGVPFGLASAPLLWGRVAAWLGRLAQAVSKPQELRCQIYVDDPVLVAAGPPRIRQRILSRVMLMWMVIGAKFAWSKAQIGSKVEWIGASYESKTHSVTASITEARIHKLAQEVTLHLQAKGMTRNLDSLAGELSWVAGIVPSPVPSFIPRPVPGSVPSPVPSPVPSSVRGPVPDPAL